MWWLYYSGLLIYWVEQRSYIAGSLFKANMVYYALVESNGLAHLTARCSSGNISIDAWMFASRRCGKRYGYLCGSSVLWYTSGT